MTQFFLRCATLAGLAYSSILAQEIPYSANGVYRDFLLPAPNCGGPSGQARAVVVGRISDDAVADAVALYNTDLVFFYAPDRQNSASLYPGGYVELALLPREQGHWGDSILTIHATGLQRLYWNASTRSLDCTLLSGAPAWQQARSLRVIPLPSGGAEIIGIRRDLPALARARWIQGALQPMADVPLPVGTISATSVDWDGDGVMEYAFDAASGLHVVSASGQELYATANLSINPSVVRLPRLGNEPDRMLWLTKNPATDGSLLFVADQTHQSGPYPSLAYPLLTQLELHELQIADFIGDGNPRVVLTNTNEAMAYLLTDFGNSDAPPPTVLGLDLSHTWSFSLDGVWSANPANPAAALGSGDLDGDGDAEILLAGHPSEARPLRMYFADGIDERNQRVQVENEFSFGWEGVAAGHEATFNIHFGAIPAFPELAKATHARVSIWMQQESESYIVPNAVADTTFCRATLSQAELAGQALQVRSVPLTETNEALYFHIHLSYIQAEASGLVARVFPALRTTFLASSPSKDPGGVGGFNTPPGSGSTPPGSNPSP